MVQLETGKVHSVPIKRLRLDPHNPRRAGRFEDPTDAKIITWLYVSAELDELLLSISTNGYMDIEPLVALRDDRDDSLIVLDGNRRLAAIRLLSDPKLITHIKQSKSLTIRVPRMDRSILSTLEKVSVYCVDSRESVRSYIGFKHMNGPAIWSTYAKARFATDWHEQLNGKDIQLIAKMIGDQHSTIARMVSTIYVLDQAFQNGLFDIEDRFTPRFKLAVLYLGLSRPQYAEYLKISENWNQYDPQPNPVNPEEFPRLKRLLMWIYGSRKDNQPPVVKSLNPDIKRLGEVLEHPESLHVLEATSDLDMAHKFTNSINYRFVHSLYHAREEIREALHSIRAFDGLDDSLLDMAEDVKEVSETVYQRMQEKSSKARFERAGL